MKETKNINTDVYITLQKERNEDYSAFLKLYANSFPKNGLTFGIALFLGYVKVIPNNFNTYL